MLKRIKGLKARYLQIMMLFLVVISLLLSACTAKDSVKDTEKETKSDTSAITDADRISFFHITTLNLPEDFDNIDNIILNELAKMANVEFVEVVRPASVDALNKYNLMMSSGDVTDVVHFTNYNDVNRFGVEGAFVELTDIIKNSPIMHRRYGDYMEQLKATDDNIYCLRAQPMTGDSGDALLVRYDLLKEAEYTEIPDSLDEWIDAMRKLKEKYPEYYPYITRPNWVDLVFKSYGCGAGYGWQYYFGEVKNIFENPLYKDALYLYREVYNEGLIDPEFVTYSSTDYSNKRLHNKLLTGPQNLGAIATVLNQYTLNKVEGAVIIPAQWPAVDDDRIDPYTILSGYPTLGNHCFAISSSSKKKAAAQRFIETLLSDEAKQLGDWGREGIEFNIVNGEKILNLEKSAELAWRGIYNTLFVNNEDRIRIVIDTHISSTDYDEDFKEWYKGFYFEQYEKILEENFSLPTNPMSFITLEPDTSSRLTEAIEEAKTITIRAMIGEISVEEFENQAANFLKKYQFITDEYNQKLPEAKKIAGGK